MVEVRGFGPATVANIGAGFDVLGMAVDGMGDEVWVRPIPERSVRIAEIRSDVPLPRAAEANVAGIAALSVLRKAGAEVGVELGLIKGLGVGTGLGSSAASAAAAAVAVNGVLENPLDPMTLVEAVVEAEAAVSGMHADNAAAAVLGGLVFVQSLRPLLVLRLPVPKGGWLALVTPNVEVPTRSARAALPKAVELSAAVSQAARLGAMVDACHRDDLAAFGRAAVDEWAYTGRIDLIPGGAEALGLARRTGALEACISGSGPTLLALCDDRVVAEETALAMKDAIEARGVGCSTHVTGMGGEGARLL